nr:MarR family transcriptional regulator [Aliiroseovarius sp. F20344]
MTDRLSEFGLKIDHFIILMNLSERENVTQTELGDGISMPNYAITRALDHLEGEGLVERRPDATSRRSHRVFLTKAGTQLMPSLFATVKTVNETFLAPLPDAQRADLAQILMTLMDPNDQTKLPG